MLGVAILRQEAFGKVTSDEGIEGSAGAGQADVQGGASPAEGRAKARDGGQSVHRSLPLLQENLTFDLLNFLALFPWRPDKSRMLAMLLGNIADGRNDYCLVSCIWTRRMTNAWKEATPRDFCDCGDTYDWACPLTHRKAIY